MTKNLFIKQTEVNSGGGLRISVYKQFFDGDTLISEEPHQITVLPLDDFDAVIAEASANLETFGYPPITGDMLDLPRQLRETARKNPLVQETLAFLQKKADDEAQRIADEAAMLEREAAEKVEADRLAKEEAEAEAVRVAAEEEKAAKIAAEERAAQAKAAAEAQEAHIKQLIADAVAAATAQTEVAKVK